MKGQGRIFQLMKHGQPRSPFWWISYYHNGKEVREVAKHIRKGTKLLATEENRSEAEKFLKKRLDAITTEQGGGPVFVGPAAERITIDDLLDALMADYEKRHKWNERVASTVKMLREHFGSWRAVAVTSEAVDKFQVELQQDGYKDASINRFCQLLGQAFKLAIAKKRLSNAPVITHLSEKDNARTGFFTEAEIHRVIANLPSHLRDFTLFAYITGMRKGEVISLRWSDVHGEQITLPAAHSKNQEARTIPLEGELAELIERRRTARCVRRGDTMLLSDYIFHRNGEPIGSFRKAWDTACAKAEIPGRLFHDLRRCAAKNLIEAGVPQAVAMKITGHKTISMFQRYAIVEPQQQREALRQAEVYRAEQLMKQKPTATVN